MIPGTSPQYSKSHQDAGIARRDIEMVDDEAAPPSAVPPIDDVTSATAISGDRAIGNSNSGNAPIVKRTPLHQLAHRAERHPALAETVGESIRWSFA